MEGEFATDLLCEALCLSRARYYRYRQGSTFKENKEQAQEVKKVFSDHKRRYGSRRIVAELKAQGKAIGRWCVRKQMKKLALQAIQPRSFVPKTTDSAHGKRNSPNLLLNQEGERLFKASAPDQVWYSDITYLPMQGGGFTYLCLCRAAGADRFIFQKDSGLASRRKYGRVACYQSFGESISEQTAQKRLDPPFGSVSMCPGL